MCVTRATQVTRSVSGAAHATCTSAPSSGNGWQKGIRPDVIFAAMTPAITAVVKMGPFLEAKAETSGRPLPSAPHPRAASVSTGRRTRHDAVASRRVAALDPTSTMRGLLPSSATCVRPCEGEGAASAARLKANPTRGLQGAAAPKPRWRGAVRRKQMPRRRLPR